MKKSQVTKGAWANRHRTNQQSTMAAECRDHYEMEDLLDLLSRNRRASGICDLISQQGLETITGGVNTPTTNKLESQLGLSI